MSVVAFAPRHLRNIPVVDASTLDIPNAETAASDLEKLLAVARQAIEALNRTSGTAVALESLAQAPGCDPRLAKILRSDGETALKAANDLRTAIEACAKRKHV